MIKARLPFSTLSVGGLWNSQLSVQCAQPQPRTLPSFFLSHVYVSLLPNSPSLRLFFTLVEVGSVTEECWHWPPWISLLFIWHVIGQEAYRVDLTLYKKPLLTFSSVNVYPTLCLNNSFAWHKWQDWLHLKWRECARHHLQWTFFKLVASWGASFTSTSSLPSNPVRTILHYAPKCETSPLGKANKQMYLLHREENCYKECQIHLKVPDWPVFPSCRNISAVLLLPVFVTPRQECLCLTVFFKDKNNLVFASVLDWWITSEPVFVLYKTVGSSAGCLAESI